MSLAEITNLKLEDVFEIILRRLIDFSATPEGEGSYYFLDENDALYDDLRVHTMYTKPSLQEFGVEFNKYKQELIVEENQRNLLMKRLDKVNKNNVYFIEAYPDDTFHWGDRENIIKKMGNTLMEVEISKLEQAKDTIQTRNEAEKQTKEDLKTSISTKLGTLGFTANEIDFLIE